MASLRSLSVSGASVFARSTPLTSPTNRGWIARTFIFIAFLGYCLGGCASQALRCIYGALRRGRGLGNVSHCAIAGHHPGRSRYPTNNAPAAPTAWWLAPQL